MTEPTDAEPNRELERMLAELFHKPQPGSAFVEDLERRLLNHPEPSRLREFFRGLFAAAPTLAWGAAAVLLILALAWTLGNLIPGPLLGALPIPTPSPAGVALTTPPPTANLVDTTRVEQGSSAIPAMSATAAPAAAPSPTVTAPASGLYPGWLRHTDPGYGFSFSYPSDWTIEAGPHSILLKPKPSSTLALTIGFKRSSEDVGIQRTGAGAGGWVERGSVIFLGETVSRQVLVDEGGEKAVLYNGGAEIRLRSGLVFNLHLVDNRTGSSSATLSQDVQGTVDRIVASFQLLSAGRNNEAYLGRLAYVQGGNLWVASLPDGKPQRLTSGGGVRQPRWSPSGERLAFRKGDGVSVVRRDGSSSQALNGGQKVTAFAWSPARDSLAYIAGAGELRLADADGKDRRVLVPRSGSKTIAGLVWSPAGDWIAYQVVQQKAGREVPYVGIWKVSPDGSRPVELYTGNPVLAGWTGDGRSLLFWDGGETFSASLLADGVPLMLLPANGGAPQQLAKLVLTYPDFVRPDPSGTGRVAVVAGGPREAWANKQLYLFQDGNSAVLSPLGYAASSPAWSFDGRQLAYTLATDAGELDSGEPARQALMERKLWVWDFQKNRSRQLTSDPAFRDEYPLWSRDGGTLLFVRLEGNGQTSLWLVPAVGGDPWLVVDELLPKTAVPGDQWFGYYGHTDWADLLDWWR